MGSDLQNTNALKQNVFHLWRNRIIGLVVLAAAASGGYLVQQFEDNGLPWHINGEGVICCPCTEPCPCRSNHAPSYAHCEATLYLHVKSGHYGSQRLDNLHVVETSGACAMNYRKSAAIYFDTGVTPAQRNAFMSLVASFFPERKVAFTHVRACQIRAIASPTGSLQVGIPGVLDLEVDRNWGKAHRSLPFVAASDYYANSIQYIRNVRYRMSDREAGLEFDYSHRQANYRVVDLGDEQYRTGSMLVQYLDGQGWFTARQLELIGRQGLQLPDLPQLRHDIQTLRSSQEQP